MVSFRRYLSAFITAIIGMALSIVLFVIVNSWVHNDQVIEFQSQSMGYANALQNNFSKYADALYFVGDFFDNSDHVTRQEFTDFVTSVITRNSEIQAFSWNPLVLDHERAEYELQARDEGFASFEFKERTAQNKLIRAEQRQEYVVVYYIDPLENNINALGYDIASNPKRLQAIEKGFATGEMAATGRIILVQETAEQYGILLLLPIYHQKKLIESSEDYFKNRKGFIVEVLRIGDVVENTLKGFSDMGIDLYLYDLSAGEEERFLYFRPSDTPKKTEQPLEKKRVQQGLYWSKNFDLAGRKWQILFSPSSFYLKSLEVWQAWVVLLVSLVLTAMLCFYLVKKISYANEIERRMRKQLATNTELENEITERIQAEKALKESKDKYRSLFQDSSDGIIVHDLDGNIIDVNQRALDLSGFTRDELLSVKVMDLHPPEELDKAKSAFKQISERGIVNFETVFKKKNGDLFPAEVSSSLFNIGDQKLIQGMIRDISERKKLELELLRVQKLESTGVLAGGIAHDFNNLLTAILGNISLAKMFAKRDHEVVDRLTDAENASVRAKDLTQQLLTFSKGGAPVKTPSSLIEVINESSSFVLSGSNSNVQLLLPDNLMYAMIDPGQISQVIQNIVRNADQAMPEGGTVTIAAENITISKQEQLPLEQGSFLKITITDQGAGIPEKFLSKVFDPYFTTKQEGSGLGLAVSYSIIRNHGGLILAESEYGVGTAFHIYLPAIDEVVPNQEKGKEEPFKGEGKVLVMDDEQAVLQIAENMLNYLGYKTVVASDGRKAVSLFLKAKEENEPFDAVILDLTVPGGMGGQETVNELQGIDSKVIALVSSGYANDQIMADFKNFGFSGSITKPYTVHKLSEALHVVLQGKQ